MQRPAENTPLTGSMVTFLLRDKDGERFRVGEVIGPVEADPQTGETWVGVRVWHAPPDRTLNLIPLSAVLNISPPAENKAERTAERTAERRAERTVEKTAENKAGNKDRDAA